LTEIKAGDTAKLHYALTDSQCNACGSHLEWRPDFGDISRPKYISNHCNYQYIIYIDDVKLDVIKIQDKEEPLQTKREQEPRAILMAEEKKEEKQSESKVSES
jgi:hypothetical protein